MKKIALIFVLSIGMLWARTDGSSLTSLSVYPLSPPPNANRGYFSLSHLHTLSLRQAQFEAFLLLAPAGNWDFTSPYIEAKMKADLYIMRLASINDVFDFAPSVSFEHGGVRENSSYLFGVDFLLTPPIKENAKAFVDRVLINGSFLWQNKTNMGFSASILGSFSFKAFSVLLINYTHESGFYMLDSVLSYTMRNDFTYDLSSVAKANPLRMNLDIDNKSAWYIAVGMLGYVNAYGSCDNSFYADMYIAIRYYHQRTYK